MYSPLDDNVCSIGTLKPINIIYSAQHSALYKSRVGGFAIWHDIRTAPKANDIRCLVCGLVEHIVLVVQLYAPIEHYHRSLYVFCCNKRICSLQSKGWIVIRNQVSIVNNDLNTPKVIYKDGNGKLNIEEKRYLPELSNDMNLIKTDKLSLKSTVSVWDSLNDDDDADSELEIARLLMERDLAIEKKKILTNISTNSNETSNISGSDTVESNTYNINVNTIESINDVDTKHIHNVYATIDQLECFEIEDIDEIWSVTDEEAAKEGDYYQLGVEVEPSHIDNLLESYFEGEDDLEILDIVSNSYKKYNTKNHTEKLTSVFKKVSFDSSTMTNKIHNRNKNHIDDDNEDESKESNLSRTSLKQQVETYFNNRVSYYPKQVIRYAYCGIPLWITHPYPIEYTTSNNNTINHKSSIMKSIGSLKDINDTDRNNKKKLIKEKVDLNDKITLTKTYNTNIESNSIPICKCCKSERVFEFQIMPALLSFINQTNSNDSYHSTTTTNIIGTETRNGLNISVSPEINDNSNDSNKIICDTILTPSIDDIHRFQETLGKGLDFGVVAIWSCPNSCEWDSSQSTSCNYLHEIAIIQGPSDIM